MKLFKIWLRSFIFLKAIFQWLRALRLHKYIEHFYHFNYDDFLSVTDSKLIELNITLGARKRLLNNIETLNGRCKRLKEISALIDENFFEQNESILKELLEISTTPMKYKNSKFSSLSSINHETFSPKLCFTEENSEDLSFNFIYIIDKSKLEE